MHIAVPDIGIYGLRPISLPHLIAPLVGGFLDLLAGLRGLAPSHPTMFSPHLYVGLSPVYYFGFFAPTHYFE